MNPDGRPAVAAPSRMPILITPRLHTDTENALTVCAAPTPNLPAFLPISLSTCLSKAQSRASLLSLGLAPRARLQAVYVAALVPHVSLSTRLIDARARLLVVTRHRARQLDGASAAVAPCPDLVWRPMWTWPERQTHPQSSTLLLGVVVVIAAACARLSGARIDHGRGGLKGPSSSLTSHGPRREAP